MSAVHDSPSEISVRCGTRWEGFTTGWPLAELEISRSHLRVTTLWIFNMVFARPQIVRITCFPPGTLRIVVRPGDRQLKVWVDDAATVADHMRALGYVVEPPPEIERKPSRWRIRSD